MLSARIIILLSAEKPADYILSGDGKKLKIGFFDSGLGGISVLNKCRELMPKSDFFYYADDAHAPYGNLSYEDIGRDVNTSVDKMLENDISALVVACNTATSVVVEDLRNRLNIPVIGIEPALAPAVREHGEEEIILLCTNATAKLDKLHRLMHSLKCSKITILPQTNLAALIEENIENVSILNPYVDKIFKPYRNAGAVVLGCTHYCFLRGRIEERFRGRVYDGNEGVAAMLKKTVTVDSGNGAVEIVLSSGNPQRLAVYKSLITVK